MENKTQEFTKKLDEIALKKWEEIYNALKDITDVHSITFAIFPSKEMLTEFNLTEDFNFLIENNYGRGKMKYYYKNYPVEPESYYLLPENYRPVPLLEMLLECIKQDTNKPDIKHLQVDTTQLTTNKEDAVNDSINSLFDESSLVGKTLDIAKEICDKNGIDYRIVREDDKDYIITADLKFDRLNFDVENGIVVKSERG